MGVMTKKFVSFEPEKRTVKEMVEQLRARRLPESAEQLERLWANVKLAVQVNSEPR